MASAPTRDPIGDHLLTPQPDPHRWQALALVCVAFLMTILDVSIVNVALAGVSAVSVVACLVLVRGTERERQAAAVAL
jgi:hypothetical protein